MPVIRLTTKQIPSGMMTEGNLALISSFVAAPSFHKLLGYLWGRWQDEKGHERIADYAIPIRGVLPEGIELVKMNKRPFGFVFRIVGTARCGQVEVTATYIGWQRVADQ